ncbi:adenylate kinase 9 isoform X2 [Girardinichthys multiradiatus]|uniref:adenylate kinase 9 isoform X2 n=1 Tax=Girardinichthys multiradiatus TaxID=208333 RepID=UPI001FAD27AD|nr:adenylate kinase 9 isoform X2 [Girardinichthys multiradiatus]
MDALVDNLIEDEAEREGLLAKPTCFIIFGRPGVGKSTLAKNIAESWKCILIDDTDLLDTHIKNKTKEGTELLSILSEGKSIPDDVVLQLILARLNLPDVEHYGYVLSCLPFILEDSLKICNQIKLIRNLKLTPDFIINIKCADKDLVQRLSGLKQHPVSGQLYSRDQWKQEEVCSRREKVRGQEVDDDEEQAEEEDLSKDNIDQMVWTPENLPRNAFARINTYQDNLLRPLEDYMAEHNPLYLLELDGNDTLEELHLSVMTRLETMAIKRVAVPILLSQYVDEELPDTIDTEYLLRFMSTIRTAAPGFGWRRSRWGRTCPVALKEGKIIPGKPELSVGFQDKLYILSSQEAYQKFVTNPRRYLLPPIPRPPCRVSIIGPSQAGKSTMCSLLARHYGAVDLNLEELSRPLLAKAELERLDKIKEETTQAAIAKLKMKMEQDGEKTLVAEDHPDVGALVPDGVEEAKQMSPSPIEMYADVLKKHIKEIEVMDSNANARTGWVLDNFPKNLSEMDVLAQTGILPDTIICLRDSDRHQVLKRVYEKNKEKVNKAIEKRLQDELSQRNKKDLNQKEQESETQSNLEMVVEEADALPDDLDLGYPNIPEMKEYEEQIQLFEGEWEHMQPSLTVNNFSLEIGSKSPEDLLLEIVQNMEKPFQYVAWELSTFDLDEEEEHTEALAAFEREEEDSSDNKTEKEDDEWESTIQRLLGDTKHFCPVALQNNNVLWPSTDNISAKYRERTYYFSTLEARESFLQNPAQFVAQREPLQPPALRIFLLGTRGSGKSTHGEWLAQKLGLFHIQFREQLQMQIIAKTSKLVPRADEIVLLESDLEHLATLIKEEMLGDDKEVENTSSNMSNIEEEVMTNEELAIKAYLSHGEALSPHILDMIVSPYFKEEPYMSTGFILEGFPEDPEQVEYMLERQLFPDVVVVLEVEATDVQKRLLPTYLEKWRDLYSKYEEQLKLLRHLRKINREEKISKRRAELMEEQGTNESRFTMRKDDEDEDEDENNIKDEIEAVLEVEFPEEDKLEEMENEETENAAVERIQEEIQDRFEKDATNLVTVAELLSGNNLPKLVFNTSRKLRIIQYDLLQKIQPLVANRESLFQTSQPTSCKLAQKLLLSSYKLHSAFGCWDPVQRYKEKDTIQPIQWPLNTTYPLLLSQYIYFFGSKENRNTFMLNPLKYLRQPKPTPTLPVKIAVAGPPKSGKTTVAQMFAEKYGLARLSIGAAMRMVLNYKKHTDLAVQMRRYLTQGLVLPDELAIQCLEVALLSSVCSIRGYVLDGFPMTLKQAELMEDRSIIPMIVFELDLETVEILKRGLVDKMNPSKPYLMHDSSEILHSWDCSYRKEVGLVKKCFQEQHQNWFAVDGLKSKWWIWKNILGEVNISMKCMHSYLERRQSGKAACINRLCITPKELECRLGEFGHYCPVCLALHHHLVDCSETAALTNAAEYKRHYYRLCGENHLENFLSTPDEFVAPCCPQNLPQPHLLPRKLTEFPVKNEFPKQAEMKSFCPVTYKEGKQRYEALVRGKMEYAVEYKGKLYTFETKQKQDMFLRTPETYWDQKLPCKVPPLCEPVPLTSLPTLGYLEQGVAVAVIKAMTAAGSLRPKHPFVSITRSALLYVAFYLKAFNPKGTDYTRQKYKKKLASFEENSELIPYLSSAMRGTYKPPGERTIDFDFKLKRFLELGASGAL